MGYYISTMIGIRTGGVFAANADISDMNSRIKKVLNDNKDDYGSSFGLRINNILHCTSRELVATKGGYVVISGVFNYWYYDESSAFASALSKEFQTEVMIMSWDEEINTIQCNVFLAGKQLFEVNENPIGQVMRRIC